MIPAKSGNITGCSAVYVRKLSKNPISRPKYTAEMTSIRFRGIRMSTKITDDVMNISTKNVNRGCDATIAVVVVIPC